MITSLSLFSVLIRSVDTQTCKEAPKVKKEEICCDPRMTPKSQCGSFLFSFSEANASPPNFVDGQNTEHLHRLQLVTKQEENHILIKQKA